jgi:hypothetical protein
MCRPYGSSPLSTTEFTAIATKVGDPSRWVRLTFGLRDGDGLAATTLLAVEPRDELAGTYGLENWKSGLLSGYFWVCRRARRMPPTPISISELSGSLSSADMEGVVKAAEAVAARLFDVEPPPQSAEWGVSVWPAVAQHV